MRGISVTFSIALIAVSALLSACFKPSPNALERVKRSGELRIVTRNTDSTYYEGPHGPAGLEYQLAKALADDLGVKLVIRTAANVSEVLDTVERGEVDFAAAGLTVTKERSAQVRFTPSYQQITPELVYRVGTSAPRSIDDLDGVLEVTARSSHAELLQQLKKKHPKLTWNENPTADSDDLLTLVWQGVLDYTVADSNEVMLNRQFYPELRVAFDLSKPQSLAWAFPLGKDDSLFNYASKFLRNLQKTGRMAEIIDRYYGHLGDFDYVGTRRYMDDIETKLPTYRPLFRKVANELKLDWRLLAAMAYQESHWEPDAVSPTGVRGIMMLTQAAASDMEVDERADPQQSIDGGSRYFKLLLDKVPERIGVPDRLWFALAAYNIGYGHLEDARIITARRGGDPDVWASVKESLPLLRQRKWYRTTKRGYARGNEAVQYVENIRSYYQILVWITEQEKPPPPQLPAALNIANPVL